MKKLIKKDKFLRKRGGTTKIIKVSCKKCGELLFVYQKDGSGWLKKCYLNRIIKPKKYQMLQHNKKLKEPKYLKNLVCVCGQLIGYPMRHKDGRLAFLLVRRTFKRTNHKL